MVVSISDRPLFLTHRLNKLVTLLRRHKITKAIAQHGFSHWDFLAKNGVRPHSTLALQQQLAGELLLHRMREWSIPFSTAKVALRGERVTPEMEQIAHQLAPIVREIAINVTSGGEGLIERLEHKWGIPPTPDTKRISASICWTEQSRQCQKNEIFIGDSKQFLDINAKNITYPSEIEKLTYLALLCECGKLRPSQIEFA
ncbi:MAG: hypothetical protein R3Y07_09355 [Eubacteriales bacterium]